MIGSGERRNKRGWVTCLLDHSFVVVSSRAGVDSQLSPFNQVRL